MSENKLGCCYDKEKEICRLKAVLKAKEEEIRYLKSELHQRKTTDFNLNNNVETEGSRYFSLSNTEIERYSRQIILPNIGVQGQLRLKNTSVLIVGAGGLGCPVGVYLAAAGVGKIGIVDFDEVEINNLHRQVSHTEKAVGIPKCESLAESIKCLNSSTVCIPYKLQLNHKNIKHIVTNYNIIVDASDNVPTRYLLNDASVMFKKPLVSGSALRLEGQVTLYNYQDGPCYRCLFPTPPTPDATTNCSDGGVVGPITGVIGSLQALEVIKIAVGLPLSFKNKLLHFDGEYGKIRVFNLRGKNPNCDVCGISPKIKELIDYETFCQASATDKCRNVSILCDFERISCTEYKNILNDKIPHVLVDVRPTYELDICGLPNCINIPINSLKASANLESLCHAVEECRNKVVYVICRRGNDSQIAVQFLQEYFKDLDIKCYDIKGGLYAWHHEVDLDFPLY